MEKRKDPSNKIYIKPYSDDDSTDDYDDDNIPAIDLPKKTDVVPNKTDRVDS